MKPFKNLNLYQHDEVKPPLSSFEKDVFVDIYDYKLNLVNACHELSSTRDREVFKKIVEEKINPILNQSVNYNAINEAKNRLKKIITTDGEIDDDLVIKIKFFEIEKFSNDSTGRTRMRFCKK